MHNPDEATSEASVQPTGRDRSRWGRVGFVSAVLWALVGLGLAFLWAQSGHPRESGFVALWTGPVTFVIVGRHYTLHGRGNWIRAAVLTISDSSFSGQREDLSGPAVVQALRARGWEVARTAVLPDDCATIRQALEDLCSKREFHTVFTTGGTGVAPRDVTPEATRQALEREVPGLSELMRREGCRHTPRAALSRGLAGIRNGTLIVNLPGSPRGAVESLEAIADLLPHAAELIRGGHVRHE